MLSLIDFVDVGNLLQSLVNIVKVVQYQAEINLKFFNRCWKLSNIFLMSFADCRIFLHASRNCSANLFVVQNKPRLCGETTKCSCCRWVDGKKTFSIYRRQTDSLADIFCALFAGSCKSFVLNNRTMKQRQLIAIFTSS